MNVNITRADESRLDECRQVFEDSPLYERYFAEPGRLETQLAIAVERGELWIALSSSGEVVGAMWIELHGFFGAFPYLSLLGVKKRFRGMGVGRTLLSTFAGVSKRLGYRKCSLLVGDFNVRARNLYQSMGYKRVGHVTDCILPGLHESIMVKDL